MVSEAFICISFHFIYSKEVIADDSIDLKLLNQLEYPTDFLWQNGSIESVIQGAKTFQGTLCAFRRLVFEQFQII